MFVFKATRWFQSRIVVARASVKKWSHIVWHCDEWPGLGILGNGRPSSQAGKHAAVCGVVVVARCVTPLLLLQLLNWGMIQHTRCIQYSVAADEYRRPWFYGAVQASSWADLCLLGTRKLPPRPPTGWPGRSVGGILSAFWSLSIQWCRPTMTSLRPGSRPAQLELFYSYTRKLYLA